MTSPQFEGRDMVEYFKRWLVAIFVVVPLTLITVPFIARIVSGLSTAEGWWVNALNMLGFYGGYALAAASAGSWVHTHLVRRGLAGSRMGQITLAAAIGILVLLPQAAIFGRPHWVANVIVGASAGLLYGFLTTLLDPRPSTTGKTD